jgi:DNA-binding transcriptional regulator YiaG
VIAAVAIAPQEVAADIEAGVRLLCAWARDRPDIPRRDAITRLANRRGWDRGSANEALSLGLERGELHLAKVAHIGIRASTPTVLRPGPAPGQRDGPIELLAPELDRMLTRANLSERGLAEALGARGVKAHQPAVNGWRQGNRRIPVAYHDLIRTLLRDRAHARVKALRERAGLTQAALGAELGKDGAATSAWERSPDRIPERDWARLMRTLADKPAVPQVDVGSALEVSELERILAASPLSNKAFARGLGVAYCQLCDWRKSRRPIPSRYWLAIRELEHAEAPEPIDHIREVVLPALEQLVTNDPGATQTDARRELEHGHESLWRATKLGIEERRIHHRRVRREVAPDRMRRVEGLFLGPKPEDLAEHERADAGPELNVLPAAVAIISESPGIGVKDLRRRLTVDPKVARAVATLACAQGEAHRRELGYTDRMGRRRRRMGLYPGSMPSG